MIGLNPTPHVVTSHRKNIKFKKKKIVHKSIILDKK